MFCLLKLFCLFVCEMKFPISVSLGGKCTVWWMDGLFVEASGERLQSLFYFPRLGQIVMAGCNPALWAELEQGACEAR